MMPKRIAAASAKRIPAKVSGGRSRSPSLIASQVEPQIRTEAEPDQQRNPGVRPSGRNRFHRGDRGARKTVAATREAASAGRRSEGKTVMRQ